MAQQIGNPYIIVVPTVTNEICTRNEKEIFDDSVKVLNEELADIAEPYGVKLSFEPIGDKKWCVNSVRQALEIVNAVNRDSVGLTVDCINVYLHDKCADVDFIRKIPKEKLFVFHINDCEDLPLGILDHCHRLMPGLGAIPVQEVADAVQAVGYDGPACLELFRPEYWRMPAEDVIRMGRGNHPSVPRLIFPNRRLIPYSHPKSTAVYQDPKELCADPNVEAVAIIPILHLMLRPKSLVPAARCVSHPFRLILGRGYEPVRYLPRCYTAFLFHIQFILYYFIFKSPNRIQI